MVSIFTCYLGDIVCICNYYTVIITAKFILVSCFFYVTLCHKHFLKVIHDIKIFIVMIYQVLF